MIWNCLDSLAILTAFLIAYILPPFIAMRRIEPAADRTTQVVMSAGLGLSSQALLGFFWNHLVARYPAMEMCAYFLLWLIISLYYSLRVPVSHPPSIKVARFSLLLPLILLAAIALRTMDSLTHSALGQSDAYTHLQFLRDVMLQGEPRLFMGIGAAGDDLSSGCLSGGTVWRRIFRHAHGCHALFAG
jgi:hypothetical protein